MGQQQILIVVLGTIIIGIGITLGILLFESNSISSNKDGLIEDLTTICGSARAYYLKPKSLGGGGNSFIGYTIPSKMLKTDNGTFSFYKPVEMNTVYLEASSVENYGKIDAKVDIFHNQLFGITPESGSDFDDN